MRSNIFERDFRNACLRFQKKPLPVAMRMFSFSRMSLWLPTCPKNYSRWDARNGTARWPSKVTSRNGIATCRRSKSRRTPSWTKDASEKELAIRGFLEKHGILSVPDWIQHYTLRPIPEYLHAL